jgi:serine/threonine protein kinase
MEPNNHKENQTLPVIEGYQVLRCIGRGTMGSVWKALQLSTQREVAIKFLSQQHLVSTKSRQRFEQEVQLTARLTHPNIARIYDSGLYQERYYYVMEYIEGIHLDQYVIQNKLDTQKIIELFIKICTAVDYAHQKSIIHRDLKPANILVTADGQPHILDFGLAVTDFQESTFVVSVEGELAGTIAYMSPEQAAGRKRQIGPACDVYSLGVILYKLLTGAFPKDMQGDYYDVLRRIVEEPAIRASQVRQIDPVLDKILAQALSQTPDQRYATAGNLGMQLQSYLSGSSAVFSCQTAAQQSKKPTLIKIIGILCLVGLLLFSVYIFRAYLFPTQSQPTVPTPSPNTIHNGLSQPAIPQNNPASDLTKTAADKSKEYQADQCLQSLDSFMTQQDYFRAKSALACFTENYSQTRAARTHADHIAAWNETILRQFKDKKIQDHIYYLSTTYDPALPIWQNAYNHISEVQNRLARRNRFILIRIMLENEILEKNFQIQGDFKILTPSPDNSFVPASRYSAQSGEILCFFDESLPFAQPKNKGRISIGSLHHYPVQLEIPLNSDSIINEGEMVIHPLPAEAKGQLEIKIETEPGLSLEGGNLLLENGLLTIPLTNQKTYNLGSIAAGTYNLITRKENSYSSLSQTIEIRPQETTRATLSVYRSRQVTFNWRFYDSRKSQPSTGQATARTGQLWKPETWSEIFYPVIELTPWDGKECMIRNAQGSLKLIERVSDFNTLSLQMILDDTQSVSSYPLQKGAIYAWYKHLNDERYEALIQIENITTPESEPYGKTEKTIKKTLSKASKGLNN